MQYSLILAAFLSAIPALSAPAAEPVALEARSDNAVVGYADINYKGQAYVYSYNYQACLNLGGPGNGQVSSLILGQNPRQACTFYEYENCQGGYFGSLDSVPDLTKRRYNNGHVSNDNVKSLFCIPSNS